jgi:hypothetical protein
LILDEEKSRMTIPLLVGSLAVLASAAVAFVLLLIVLVSGHRIGPNEVGLVEKRYARGTIADGPIAFNGEAGYQADLLMPGYRFKLWPIYRVHKHPWVQVPPGEIGVVVSQVGAHRPVGSKSAVYKPVFGQFTDVRGFVSHGGQQGVQRPALPPGTLLPLHPIAFLVLTKSHTYGEPVNQDYRDDFGPQTFGLDTHDLELTLIEPRHEGGKTVDMVGIVITQEGDPLESGDIASRLGRFDDVKGLEREGKSDAEIVDVLIGNQNTRHNNYQDFQAFVDAGGKIGLQHDPLLYGTYVLNPYLVRVEREPMLVVRQGEVAVIKAAVGLPTEDTSGDEFKFGSIVRPGHRGIWQEPLRTGKYTINPRIYQAEMVPTAILTLNWAEATSRAHNLDQQLSQIEAKSKEGFEFAIDLQVQIHVADKMAPRVISMVGTMQNLVNEVLQAVVGNYFRDTLQGMEAVRFIEQRAGVQRQAQTYIETQIRKYNVETKGVYIQDVSLPEEIVVVLKSREIAKQEKATFAEQKDAQIVRVDLEKARGRADKQNELASSEVDIVIRENRASARKKEADGDAYYTSETGRAKAAEVEATGLARAKGYEAQVGALGQDGTAIVNLVNALVTSPQRFVPDILVQGSNGSGDALTAGVLGFLREFNRANGGRAATSKSRPSSEP